MMAGFNYARMQATADRLMQRFKQGTITLSRATSTVPDPNEPWNTVPTTAVFTLKATARSVEENFINGTSINASDIEITAGPKATNEAGADVDLDVQPGDVVAIDGVSVSTVEVVRIPAAGTLIAWKFVVRG
jgi:hypothetical protein